MKYAYLFPGQGVQTQGMGKSLYEHYDSVKELFTLSSDIVHQDVKKLLFDTDDDTLQITKNAQIAITLVNLASVHSLEEQGIVPSVLAGFSLGEYSAMVTANVISVEDVFELVVIRGTIMEEESRVIEQELKDEGHVGMTAVLGMNPTQIQDYLDRWDIANVHLAMCNSPIQGVIAGTEKGRTEAADKLIEAGAKRVLPLKVSGPFHTILMERAKTRFSESISHITFSDPQIPLFSNVDGQQVMSGNDMKARCLDQLVNPVQWIQEEEGVHSYVCDRILEVGYGNVLSGLWKAWKKNKNDDTIPSVMTMGSHQEIQSLEE